MKTNIISIIFLIVICPKFGFAQSLTQNDFLNKLISTHPFLEKEELTAEIETEEQKSYTGTQDWNIFASAAFIHDEPVIAFAGPERTDALSLTGGVEKLFWETGGSFSASFNTTLSNIKIDPMFGFPSSFQQNQITLKYTHPLMKNSDGFLNKLQYDLKQYDIDFSEVQSIENKENFLAGSAQRYLDWVFLNEQKMIIAERIKLSEEELERTKRKREAHLVDQVDVIRAEDAVRIWKQNHVLIESQLNAIRAELAVLANDDEIISADPDFNLYEIEDSMQLDDILGSLEENSRLINILDIRINQIEHSRDGYEEMSKPDLSLMAEVNLRRIDEVLVQSFLMNKPEIMVGLNYSFPLENRTADFQIAKSDLQVTQLEKYIEDIKISLKSVLTNLYVRMDELKNVLELNKEQIESAKKRTEEELKLYNQGRGDLTFVIMSRDNEQNAKLTYAGNALTYQKLLIEYKALADRLYN
ncbi:TolC family protein [Bacteroidota bacterium]